MLTREIAYTIVKETSLRLNRNINIMNDKGIIIASSDESRIDDIHEGALEVLKNGRILTIPTDHKEKWRGSQPGINLPIVFQDKIVGVIGITGNPDEVRDLGGIVKMATELMINQEFISSQMEWKQRTKEMIIEELLKTPPSYDHIDRGLNLLGLKLQPPFITLIIHMTERTITNQSLIKKVEEIIGEKNGIVSFININRIFLAFSNLSPLEASKKIEKLYRAFKRIGLHFRLAYSTPFDHLGKFSESYIDCGLALEISDPSEEIISFAEIEAKALIFQLNRKGAERFSQRIMNAAISKYTQTLECFFKHNLNIRETADELFIHRNTLLYRLKKIEEETGYDPKNFKDALTLQLAIWISQKLKNEESIHL